VWSMSEVESNWNFSEKKIFRIESGGSRLVTKSEQTKN
jgi:hypothetical protein